MTQTHNEEHHDENNNCCENHEHQSAEARETPNEIQQLKAEILSTLENKAEKPKLPWGSLSVTIVLALLTLLSVVQTAQSAILLSKIKSGNVNLGGSAPAASVQDAPDMVGGC
ncbi:MAG: hypothetical protein HY569_02315 [Candidatus Magasanikbacteria bacterium]|nr:hypothetical protein [Candidatus Magasanikbacteria bacterium]